MTIMHDFICRLFFSPPNFPDSRALAPIISRRDADNERGVRLQIRSADNTTES